MHQCTQLFKALCQRYTEVHSLTIPPGAGLVGRPYHGPRIDVEELAPTGTSRCALAIAHPSGIMRALQLVPVIWNRPVHWHAVGDQGQSAQNIPEDDWPGLWLIEELGSRVCDLPPPIRLPPAAREYDSETSSEHKHLHKHFFGAHDIFI